MTWIISILLNALAAFVWYKVGHQVGCEDGFARGKRAQEALHDVKKHCGILSVMLLLSLLASDASACIRCGRAGNQCAYVAHAVHQPAIAITPVAAIQQPSVFAITNVYPQANTYGGQGLPLTAQQGNTQYGYTLSQAIQPIDPGQIAYSVMSMYNSANQGAQQALKGANDHMNAQAAYSYALSQPIAQATAAKIVLDAAGVHPQAQQFRQQQTGYKITFDASGVPKVEPLQAEQIQAAGFRAKYPQFDPNGYTGGQQKPPCDPPAPSPIGNSLLAQKCNRCHGAAVASPQGSFQFDVANPIDCITAMKAIRAVRSGAMPKGESLAAPDKEQLISELLELSK